MARITAPPTVSRNGARFRAWNGSKKYVDHAYDGIFQKSPQKKNDPKDADHRDDQNGNAENPSSGVSRDRGVSFVELSRHLFGDPAFAVLCRFAPMI